MAGSTRRVFLRTAGLSVAALAAPRAAVRAAEAPARRPNILFLFTDDQREDTVAALGNPHILTPHLDGLVKGGTAFRNAYCMGGFSAAVCLPSRMMLARGRAWFTVQQHLHPNLPKTLGDAGYETYHHGKIGNVDKATNALFARSRYTNDGPERASGYPGKEIADAAVAFLRQRDRAKPFFMYLAFANPHDPRKAAPEYLAQYDPAKLPLPPNFLPFHPFNNGELLVRDECLASWPRTEADIRRHLHEYYAVVTALDEQIGRILAALRDSGEHDNTILLFSSDQGIAIGSHGLMGKQNLYEHSMGVPLVFAGPGIPKGKTTDAFAYLFDVFPTLCDLAGVPVPEGLDGKSLAPVLRGEKDGVRDTVFLAYKNLQRAVRRGRWKLLRYPQVNKTQLFDLEADPYETRDLAADPTQAERVKELLALMADQQKLFGDPAPLSVPNPSPAEVTLDFFKTPPPAKKAKRE